MAKRLEAPAVRCAIYTRKITEEGLEQEFNSLDAQREAGEAYIASQRGEGWTCVPDRYDDGGYTGGNMERPALKRLMADIEAGRVDCVVRLQGRPAQPRSLLDFTRIMETLEKRGVSFVSVTQQFNTTNSMGRLTLNILLSFAQFEREIISERTRDKIAAARRKGKWSGGRPILGFDVDPRGGRLMVNEEEAARVRAIFELYLEHGSLVPTIREIDARGWTNKRWTTKKGHVAGGAPLQQARPPQPAHQRPLHGADHLQGRGPRRRAPGHRGPGGVPAASRQLLRRNGLTGGKDVRNPLGALLKGLIHCVPCDSAMVHTHTTKNGNRRYRYYVCTNAQKRGWHDCPSKSIPAREIEQFVVDQVRGIGSDTALLAETLDEARAQGKARIMELEAESRTLTRDLGRHNAELRELGRADRHERDGHGSGGRSPGSHPGRRAAKHPGPRGAHGPRTAARG